jgi:hypothetical protein
MTAAPLVSLIALFALNVFIAWQLTLEFGSLIDWGPATELVDAVVIMLLIVLDVFVVWRMLERRE